MKHISKEDIDGMEVLSIRYVAREGSLTRDGVYVTYCPSMPHQSSAQCGDQEISILLEEGQTLDDWISDKFPVQ